MTWQPRVRLVTIDVSCSWCQADIGRTCRSPSGQYLHESHAERHGALYDMTSAWDQAPREALRDMILEEQASIDGLRSTRTSARTDKLLRSRRRRHAYLTVLLDGANGSS